MKKLHVAQSPVRNNHFAALVLILLLLMAVATAFCWKPLPVLAQQPAKTVNCAAWAQGGDFPPVPNTIDSTCAVVPADFLGELSQGNFDVYSWITFVAENWPLGQGCAANTSQSILTSPPNPVWLSYLQDTDVFVPAGQQPATWCFGQSAADKPTAKRSRAAASAERAARLQHLPAKVQALAAKHPEVHLFLHRFSKASDPARIKTLAGLTAADSPIPGILQATGDILVDQNGRWARYTVSFDQDEYSYITGNTLWTTAGQKAAKPIAFPTSPLGAMEFKAAWKILGANDDPTHFFTMQAIVYNDNSGDTSPGPNPVTVGLVGLHMTHKTKSQANWIWSTFEQVENDTKSFYNPNCSTTQCPPNTRTVPSPTTADELNAQGKPNYNPAQVVAVTPPTSAQSLNSTFQGLLKGTPWAYYQLISTQWSGETPGPHPTQLGNSVQETFVTPGNATYGCIQCHTPAVDKAGNNADFSWMLYFGPQQ